MYKLFLSILFLINVFSNVLADYEKYDEQTLNIYKQYEKCELNIDKTSTLAITYDLYVYTNYSKNYSSNILKCNSILEKIINNKKSLKMKQTNFMDEFNKAVINNEKTEDNIYIDIFKTYHSNIIWNSKNIEKKKKSLFELNENYINKSNILKNQDVLKTIGSLGWFYNVDHDFFDFDKSYNYLNIASKNEQDGYYLKYYQNNLGVIYDQDRYGNNSTKKNNKIAYEFYRLAAQRGLHHSYGNLAKFYILGLGGVEKNYDKAIKYYKLARIASYGDDNFSNLKVLYEKKRVPNDLNEYILWLEDYLIKNQDAQTFQEIAWMLDENENKKNTKYVFMEIYKWQYLCHKLCISFEDSNRALSEMNIISKINLSDTDVKNAILDAKKWIDKNWNKPVQNKKNNIVDIKDKTIVDLIRNALIRD